MSSGSLRAGAWLQAEDIGRVGGERDEPDAIVRRERQGDRLHVFLELIEHARALRCRWCGRSQRHVHGERLGGRGTDFLRDAVVREFEIRRTEPGHGAGDLA